MSGKSIEVFCLVVALLTLFMGIESKEIPQFISCYVALGAWLLTRRARLGAVVNPLEIYTWPYVIYRCWRRR